MQVSARTSESVAASDAPAAEIVTDFVTDPRVKLIIPEPVKLTVVV